MADEHLEANGAAPGAIGVAERKPTAAAQSTAHHAKPPGTAPTQTPAKPAATAAPWGSGNPESWSADEASWHESAPQPVVTSYLSGDSAGGWKAWKKHLLRRRQPAPISSLWSGKHSILTWGAAALRLSPRLDWLVNLLGRPAAKREACAAMAGANAEQWLEADGLSIGHVGDGDAAAHSSVALPGDDLEPLTWAHLLAARPDLLPRDLWWRILDRLLRVANQSSASLTEQPLEHQWLCGELPLTLAYLLPELRPCRQLQLRASDALSAGVEELLDGEGLPQCRYLPAFRALVACWTRCRLLAERMDEPCWNDAAEEQYPLAVRETWRLARQDGSQALGPIDGEPADAESKAEDPWHAAAAKPSAVTLADSDRIKAAGKLWRRDFRWLTDVASRLADDRANRRLAELIVSSRRKQAAPKIKEKQLPATAVYSEWAELAILRSDWNSRSTRLCASFAGHQCEIELSVGGELLASGPWNFDATIDGASLRPAGAWREVCWVSDTDCDYLELEIELERDTRLQRQMLLAKQDQVLFLADALLTKQDRPVAHASQLTLTPGAQWQAADESTELRLRTAANSALALPLALPEWRRDARNGRLAVESGRLCWMARSTSAPQIPATAGAVQSADSDSRVAAVYAPLWLDLSKRRADKPFTWRQLTVAEQRRILTAESATGYRVQFGKKQWLVYRSLTAPANRSILGQNLSTDFFLGRFGRDGETETILEIE